MSTFCVNTSCDEKQSISGDGQAAISCPDEAEERLYRLLLPYVLTEKQLSSYGYPRPCPRESGRAQIQSPYTKRRPNPEERECVRCKKLFCVDANGEYSTSEKCYYHPRKHTHLRHECCGREVCSDGCEASLHIYKQYDSGLFDGFVSTQPAADGQARRVYAVDCEMYYTKRGIELARATVVDCHLNTAYDALAKPLSPVLDYRTPWSGLTSESFDGVETTLRDVQQWLLRNVSADAILIGHALENDLYALQTIHSTVVDTSVAFPHRRGPPFRRTLKALAKDFLQKTIQEQASGHDSTEDAVCCMQLMQKKVGWRK